MRIRFLTWDCRGQINIKNLNRAISEVFDGKQIPSVTDAQFGGDSYAVVVSSESLTEEQAHAVYHSNQIDRETDNPHDFTVEIDLSKILAAFDIQLQKKKAEQERREQLKQKALKKLSEAERKALRL